MNVSEVTPKEYNNIVLNPFTIFDTVAFSELNQDKVDQVKYLIFNDGKNRFGLIAGLQNNVLKAPFSAPYACFSPISKDNKMICYHKACQALVSYAKNNNITNIQVTLPPTVYDANHIARLYNSFFVAGFSIQGCDLNFQYDLNKFDQHYEMNIEPRARQKLRASIKNNLTFEKTDDIKTAYEIIKQNRAAKNYPLWMTLDNIFTTIKLIDADFFLVFDEKRKPIASAMIYYISKTHVQVIYWGNTIDSDSLRPMNFLSYKIFKYYKNKNIKLFDVGPSTEFSQPNFGLCDFKQSIGCDTSSKITFQKKI